MHTDAWAITPSTSATFFKAAAAVASGGAIPLLQTDASLNGCGYLLSITSTGVDNGRTFTVVGIKVGDSLSRTTTETITGPNTTTVTSVNYYAKILSVSIDAASAGNISIGTSGSLALPRCRIKSCWALGAASAGTLVINSNSTAGTQLLRLDTPASSGASVFSWNLASSTQGILTSKGASNDFAIITLTNIPTYTLVCG